MGGERGKQHEPPQTDGREQKRCNHDSIRRPKNRHRMRLKCQCETDFASKIVSSEHPQPDHQQVPVKNRARIVRSPCSRLNVRGFKGDGSTFHESGKEFFLRFRCRLYCRCGCPWNGSYRRNPQPCVPTPFHGLRDYRPSPSGDKQHFIHELCGPGGSAVPGRGLEPLWISPPDPKSGASTNFATLALYSSEQTSWASSPRNSFSIVSETSS